MDPLASWLDERILCISRSTSTPVCYPCVCRPSRQLYYKGCEAYVIGGYAGAHKWFKQAAEQGDAKAQYILVYMFENGMGVNRNSKAAAGWYTLATEQGYVVAQYKLGFMFFLGNGATHDLRLHSSYGSQPQN